MCSEPGPKPSSVPIELRWLAKQVRPLVHLHLASFLCLTAASLLGLLAPLVLKWLIDQIIPQKQTGLLALAVGLIFLSFQGKTALAGLGNYLLLSAAQRTALSLRMRLLRHLDTLSSDYYEDTPVGAVMYPLKEPVEEIASFGSDLLPAILRSLLTTCFTVAAMFALRRFQTRAMRHAVNDSRPVFGAVTPEHRQCVAFDAAMDEKRAALAQCRKIDMLSLFRGRHLRSNRRHVVG